MYTWIIKIAIDVAKTTHMTYLLISYGLSIIGDFLIRNNIFLDKDYHICTCLN